MAKQASATAAQPEGYQELFRTGNIFSWLYPPVDAIELNKFASVALPAVGAVATVLQFTVPRGRNCRIVSFGIDFVANGGAAFTVGIVPPQLSFQFFRDASQGVTGDLFPDFENFSFLPGSTILPAALGMGLFAVENQLVTLTVTNPAAGGIAKTSQFVCARAVGYFYPKNREPKESANK